MAEASILRRKVIENATVAGLIGSRFYEGELATITRPRYPCANFAFTGGDTDPDIGAIGTRLFKIWTWSKDDYDETREIYVAIKAVIDNERFTDAECYVVFKQVTEPINYYEAIDKVYCTVGNFRAKRILI